MPSRKRIVAFVPTPLLPSSPNGFAPRWLSFLRTLAERHDLEVVFARGLWDWGAAAGAVLPEDFPAARVSIVDCAARDEGSRIGALWRAYPAVLPRCELKLDRHAAAPPDLVVCFLAHTAQFAEAFAEPKRVLYVLEEWPGFVPRAGLADLRATPGGIWRAVFWASQRAKMKRFFRRCASAGTVLLLSEDEARQIGRFAAPEKLRVILHGVDCGHVRPDWTENAPTEEFDIAIVGVMSEPRNYVPALRFYEAVSRIAGGGRIRWAFVGRNPGEALRRLQSDAVLVTGTVDDVRPYYARSKVIAVPVESSGGIKTAIPMAWAMRRPVATTRGAVEGIPAALHPNMLLAGSLEELARKTVELLADPRERQRLADAGLRGVRERLDYRVLAGDFLALCEHLMADARGAT